MHKVKMKRLQVILTTFLTLTVSMSVRADYPPDVYAICEITLKSGETIEGIIQIDKGMDCGYHPHGFATRNKKYPTIHPRLFEIGLFYGTWEQKFGEYEEVYFLYNETCEWPDWETEFDSSGSDLILLKTSTQHLKYRLMDTLQIYSDLGIDERPLPSSATSIATSKIATFRLLTQPSDKWKDLIAERHIEPMDDKEAEAMGRSGDWDWPAWLHDLAESHRYQMKLILEK